MIRLIAIAIILILTTSCAKVQYIPVEKKTTEIIERRDTSFIHTIDTIYVDRVLELKSDTSSVIEMSMSMSRVDFIDGKLHHTHSQGGEIMVNTEYVYVTRTDSIPYPIEVIITKESKRDRMYVYLLSIAIVLILMIKIRK